MYISARMACQLVDDDMILTLWPKYVGWDHPVTCVARGSVCRTHRPHIAVAYHTNRLAGGLPCTARPGPTQPSPSPSTYALYTVLILYSPSFLPALPDLLSHGITDQMFARYLQDNERGGKRPTRHGVVKERTADVQPDGWPETLPIPPPQQNTVVPLARIGRDASATFVSCRLLSSLLVRQIKEKSLPLWPQVPQFPGVGNMT